MIHISIDAESATRKCGGCTLCCKLLPMKSNVARVADTMKGLVEMGAATPQELAKMVPDFDKPSGARCKHSRHGKGCAIYERRPFGCHFWTCRWLSGDDTADLRRPDRSHYVIDVMPDFITIRDDESGRRRNVEIVQIWVDPDFPDAHREPALRAYLLRRAQEGKAGLIRYSANEAFVIFAPTLSIDGQWHEVHSTTREHQHTAKEIAEAIQGA